jgi:hypothetical protein
MNTRLILKIMIFDFAFQLSMAMLPAKAQTINKASANEMINASITEKGELKVIPSKTSSQSDFDFFPGSWNIINRKLKTRLNNCTEWENFNARQDVNLILNGIGNSDRYYANLNGTNFEGMTLRLFNPKTKLWSIYWADSNEGKLDLPVTGSFENNIGKFYAKDAYKGKKVIVMFKWDKTDPAKPVWSQAFSADNGKTWEWNWYMNFEKISSGAKDPELSENQNIKVLELRNYILKPGKRDDFINYFEKHFITSQNILGGYVLGQFRIKDAGNRFLWFRGFSDMNSRSIYLPEFYRKSPVWQKFKAGANELIADNDDVHLLKPLNDTGINTNSFARHKGIVVVDYYIANDSQLDQLINLYKTKYAPYLQSIGVNNSSLWVSEPAANDYPSLPVIQDKNLLVVITFYKNEAEYQSKLKLAESNTELQGEIKKLIKGKATMITYPTEKSFGEIAE